MARQVKESGVKVRGICIHQKGNSCISIDEALRMQKMPGAGFATPE